jgi:hypothetical protein
MMAPNRTLPSPGALPLFAWPEIREIEAARLELVRRIALLPPHSHRRVELTARLKNLTERQMRLQIAARPSR